MFPPQQQVCYQAQYIYQDNKLLAAVGGFQLEFLSMAGL